MKIHQTVLYFNGLSNGEVSAKEVEAFHALDYVGIDVHHAGIDWRSSDTLQDHIERSIEKTYALLKKAGRRLTLMAHSAGVSLEINVLAALLDAEPTTMNVTAVGIAGRIHAGPATKYYPWQLDRMAHIGTRQESTAFRDSVLRCENESLPALFADDQEHRLTIMKPKLDLIVPKPLMVAPGIETITLNAFGHDAARLAGAEQMAISYETAA